MSVACPHRPACPGCPLAEVPYAAQLERKRARLAAALARYPLGLQAPSVRPATREIGYRHRLKLPLARRGDRWIAGLYDPQRRVVLDTPDCPVLEPGLRDGLKALLGALDRRSTEVHSVNLRRSAATGALQLVLACEGGELPGGGKAARALLHAVPGLASVAVSRADRARKRVMGQAPRVVAGLPFVEEAIGATRYRLHPGAFFQADPENAAQLHGLVRAMVGDAPRVLDLYAGVGAYARMLAPGRRRVVAVEEVPQAAEAARAGAPPELEVWTGRVEDARWDEAFDAAILNPARRGSDPATLARLARAAPRLVYVSCGPETLARDLDALATFGLHARELHAVDLFPQTGEVETVVRLERGPPRTSFPVPGGLAHGPWDDPLGWSGAQGAPRELIALVIGDPGLHGRLSGGHFERLALVATHGLVRLTLDPPSRAERGAALAALGALGRAGHPVAGHDPRTADFFAEKAGLLRPFVHVLRADGARAPLHGDLAEALVALGLPEERLPGRDERRHARSDRRR